MSGAELAAALGIAGVVVQLVGVGLVIFDVRDVRRTAGDLLRQDATVRAVGVASKADVPMPTVTGGEPPTTSQRVDHLERRVRELQEELRQVPGLIEDALADERARSIAGYQELHEENRGLRELMHSLLTTGLVRRGIGAWLVVGGTALLVAAAIVQAATVF